MLEKVGIDQKVQQSDANRYVDAVLPGARPSGGIATLVFWLIFVFFLVTAIGALQIPTATNFMNQVLAFLPNVIVAILIFVVAALLSGAVAGGVAKVMGDTTTGKVVAAVVPALIMVIAMFMILEQLQIAPEIVRIAFAAVMFAIALALALAFGLGGRDVAARLLEDAHRKTRENADTDQGGPGTGPRPRPAGGPFRRPDAIQHRLRSGHGIQHLRLRQRRTRRGYQNDPTAADRYSAHLRLRGRQGRTSSGPVWSTSRVCAELGVHPGLETASRWSSAARHVHAGPSPVPMPGPRQSRGSGALRPFRTGSGSPTGHHNSSRRGRGGQQAVLHQSADRRVRDAQDLGDAALVTHSGTGAEAVSSPASTSSSGVGRPSTVGLAPSAMLRAAETQPVGRAEAVVRQRTLYGRNGPVPGLVPGLGPQIRHVHPTGRPADADRSAGKPGATGRIPSHDPGLAGCLRSCRPRVHMQPARNVHQMADARQCWVRRTWPPTRAGNDPPRTPDRHRLRVRGEFLLETRHTSTRW